MRNLTSMLLEPEAVVARTRSRIHADTFAGFHADNMPPIAIWPWMGKPSKGAIR